MNSMQLAYFLQYFGLIILRSGTFLLMRSIYLLHWVNRFDEVLNIVDNSSTDHPVPTQKDQTNIKHYEFPVGKYFVIWMLIWRPCLTGWFWPEFNSSWFLFFIIALGVGGLLLVHSAVFALSLSLRYHPISSVYWVWQETRAVPQ